MIKNAILIHIQYKSTKKKTQKKNAFQIQYKTQQNKNAFQIQIQIQYKSQHTQGLQYKSTIPSSGVGKYLLHFEIVVGSVGMNILRSRY